VGAGGGVNPPPPPHISTGLIASLSLPGDIRRLRPR
jgi:hypothetical protein